ncbi:MAG: hypothetical protein LBC72_05785 [Spirochaetaceae bacterium]|nr:hypothetical protein [Spirochaetaceae bacterium]
MEKRLNSRFSTQNQGCYPKIAILGQAQLTHTQPRKRLKQKYFLQSKKIGAESAVFGCRRQPKMRPYYTTACPMD